MNAIAGVILAALLVDALLGFVADVLNLKQVRFDLPRPFKGWFPPDRYAQSQAYLKDNTRFGWCVQAVDLVLLLTFWFGGGFAVVDGWARALGLGFLGTGLVYIGVLVAIKAVLGLPFGLYATFVIEERYGFNQSSLGTFFKDRLKGAVLAILIGGPLLAAVLAFFHGAGANAWWYCWIVTTVFMLTVQYAAPRWILPLFNRFEPLAEGQLRDAITAYARSIDFSLDNIFVMDGSRRSSKSNAFFTGFGRHRRIVLYDTLIEKHSQDELVAVLAHEMGHYKKRHILKMMLIGVGQTGVMFYLLSFFISYPGLFEAFKMPSVTVYAGLIFFGLLYAPVDRLTGLLTQMLSRQHEFSADAFAVSTAPNSSALATALKKLSVDNLSNLRPHPFYVFLHYTHPPVLERIQAIERRIAARSPG